MTQHEIIPQIVLEMKPGPEGQMTQREVLRALQKAYEAGYKEGEYHGRVQELRRQSVQEHL